MNKIAVIGLGYVGLSNALLFAQQYHVLGVDNDLKKLAQLEKHQGPLADKDMSEHLLSINGSLSFTANLTEAVNEAKFALVCLPTDLSPKTMSLETSLIEEVLSEITEINPKISIVIRSTIPIGFVKKMRCKLKTENLFFAPEFLTEGNALHDNLHPSRLIIGCSSERAKEFVRMLSVVTTSRDYPILHTGSEEAEAIKLFSNTYLAMRVAFFNELDTLAIQRDLDAKEIITGVSSDPRVGDLYNNPSFGYGGYCLPKDSQHLIYEFRNTPQTLMSAIVASNKLRCDAIVAEIVSMGKVAVGIYRLQMKKESDNFRNSSVINIMQKLEALGYKIFLFEPMISDQYFGKIEMIEDFGDFLSKSDVILANRTSKDLECMEAKVFTRDLFGYG